MNTQVKESVIELIEDMGLLREEVSMLDQAKYRYILVPDGNTVADRLLRQMLSRSVIIKESSPCRNSWFGMLSEYENYIPLPGSENELVQLIEKLNKEVGKAETLAEEAVKTALAVGDLESFQRYNVDSLWCFFLGSTKCAERFKTNPCQIPHNN